MVFYFSGNVFYFNDVIIFLTIFLIIFYNIFSGFLQINLSKKHTCENFKIIKKWHFSVINPFSTGKIEKLGFWDANNSTNLKYQ